MELLRTQDILTRCLPAGGRVIDVGGGPGTYATWLRDRGYDVEVIDPVPLHVEQARAAGVSARLGDARELPFGDREVDAVLLLGPLYHLPDRAARVQSLAECRRVLRPGGVVAAAAITRWAMLIDAVVRDWLADPEVAETVRRALGSGAHANVPGRRAFFTTSYFHTPDELAAEAVEAGLASVRLYAVESFLAAMGDAELDCWLGDESRRERTLAALRHVEREPSMMGASGHLLALGTRLD